jgi:HK97 family phage major capsid protein
MNKLAELKKRLDALKAEGTKIVEAAERSDDGLTDEQDARLQAIEDEITDVKAEIDKAERLKEARRTMLSSTSLGGGNSVGDQASDPAAGFKDLGEFATAVHGAIAATKYGGSVDERLVAVSNSHEGGGTSGEGYALPPQFRDEVWELALGFDEFGPLIDEEPTGAREVKLGVDESTPWGATGVKAYWRSEGTQMTPTKLASEGRSVPLHEMYCMALATEELLEDAVRLRNRLTNKAAQAIAWKKNLAIIEGTGVGQPLGWFKSGALLTIPKESGQAADTITAANVMRMFARLQRIPGDSPFWMVNQDCLPQLMTMTIGDKPIWLPPSGDLTAAPGGFLLGLPVRFSEFAKTLGDKGDIQLISPKGYYGVRRAAGLKFASSIHLYFDYNTEAFRWVFRYGGQPHLSAPVSPANGTATKSHFVTLAERA